LSPADAPSPGSPGADPRSDAAAVAGALLGAPVDAIEPARGTGRNSRVYCVRSGRECFALKHYPPHEAGGRDRLGIELGALELMRRGGIAVVPRVVASDRGRGYALLEWIAGEAVAAPGEADIDAAADFLAQIHRLRTEAAVRQQPLAAEACLSGREVVAQIARRIARLGDIAAEPVLAGFLAGEVAPLLVAIAARAEAAYVEGGLAFGLAIDASSQTLCPSDFGFHNALRTPAGQLVFIDFDYFGRDDPAKLVSDFLLHPGMALPEALKRRFAAAALGVYGGDPAFSLRLRALYPLFALRWCMILLNEFLPERWTLRVHAGERSDWEAAKRRQLDRAREWVQSLAANFQWFPYA
jgi:hypothetical protein